MPWERREGLDELPTTALRHCHYREDAWVQQGQCMSEVEAGQQITVCRVWMAEYRLCGTAEGRKLVAHLGQAASGLLHSLILIQQRLFASETAGTTAPRVVPDTGILH